ncbi:MAG: DbpA RNA binding domain-containing protein, partial [Gemmatimonadaceae bacterium]
VPKDGDRTIIADHMTSELEGLVERVAAKPRRLTHDLAPVGEGAAREVGYLITAVEQRAAALQHLLDARDATGLAVVADDPAAAKDAADALRSLGMLLPGDARVVAASDTDVTAALIVWYGVPESAERIDKLCAAAGESAEIVLLASAADLYRIKALGPRLRLVPLTIAPVLEGSAGRQRAVRDELRRLLSQEPVYADVATIEPLLADYSGAEVAAAAVRLLERERIRMERQSMRAATPLVPAVQRPAPRTERVVSPRSDAPFTRIYLNVGERDGARRGDLVGAITGEAGIAGPQIGRIDMRDTYSLVDIASDVVGQVLERLTGVTIRGRRVSARLDLPREARSGSRPTRGPGAGDRPRVAREHEEWTGRAERLRYSRRPAPDTAAPPPTPPPPPEPERGGGGDAPR